MSSAAELDPHRPGRRDPLVERQRGGVAARGHGHAGVGSDRGAVGRHGRAGGPGPAGVVLPARRRPRRQGEEIGEVTGNPREMGRELRSILEDLAEGAAA